MDRDSWDVKVTSKGQITLPKGIRDTLLVRDGDRLEAWMEDESIVLRKKRVPTNASLVADYARSELQRSHPGGDHLTARELRSMLPRPAVELTRLIRDGRERS